MKPTYDREAVNKNIEAIIRFGSCSFDEYGESVENVFVDLEICKTAPEGIVSFNMPRTKSIARIDIKTGEVNITSSSDDGKEKEIAMYMFDSLILPTAERFNNMYHHITENTMDLRDIREACSDLKEMIEAAARIYYNGNERISCTSTDIWRHNSLSVVRVRLCVNFVKDGKRLGQLVNFDATGEKCTVTCDDVICTSTGERYNDISPSGVHGQIGYEVTIPFMKSCIFGAMKKILSRLGEKPTW